jgi:hypothetical protein
VARQLLVGGTTAGGVVPGRCYSEGGGLPLAGAGHLVELVAEALVLGLQGTQASLKGLASGTRDRLYTSFIGEALATSALPRPWSRDQLELDALNKYGYVKGLLQSKLPGPNGRKFDQIRLLTN